MTADIVLIGPMNVGKSTVGASLAKRLGLFHYSMDMLRWGYYAEINYDDALAGRSYEKDGFWGLYRHWRPFELHAVERLLGEHAACRRACVIDLGAGHSVYDDEAQFARVAQAMAPFDVVLLLPSPDEQESIRVLNKRIGLSDDDDGLNAFFVRHPSNRDLATLTVYTNDKTPEETCTEIIDRLRR